MIKNKTYECTVTGYTNEGQGVSKIDGFVVFINGAVLGDELLIKIIKVTKNISYAIIEKIIKPSINRITPECDVFYKCGGCATFNMTYDEELEFKRQKVENVIKRIGKIDFSVSEIIGSDLQSRYRNKAQFPLGTKDGQAVAGFYRKNSHDVTPTKDCLIQTKNSNNITNFIVDFCNKNNISIYNEANHKGLIRHIYIRTGFKTDEILVCLVTTNYKIPHIDELVSQLTRTFPEIISVLLNKNSEKTNKVLGEDYKILFGNGVLTDVLCGNKFEISPQAFYQVNRDSAEKLYEKAIDFSDLNKNQTVLDMYCGVGTITLAVSKYVKNVIGIEIVPKAIVDAKRNAQINDIHNAEFICADARLASADIVSKKIKIDTVIVDPPRKGLDIDTINSIIKINPEKITYVSCDPATLARDINIFSQNGYELKKAIAFDLFPRTHHVESVVLLQKQ